MDNTIFKKELGVKEEAPTEKKGLACQRSIELQGSVSHAGYICQYAVQANPQKGYHLLQA